LNVWVQRVQSHKAVRLAFLLLITFFLAYQIGVKVMNPGYLRLLAGGAVLFLLYALSQRRPVTAIFLLMLYIPFMGFFRRILIPYAGWNSTDPLVIVQPMIVLILTFQWAYEIFIKREPIKDDTALFRLVRWMLVIDILQIFNPIQGSLVIGFSGIIFYIVPVCFMILGREHINEAWIKRIYMMVFIIGILVSLYGYKQFLFGLFPFEEAWVELGGYTALMVYNELRPISTFNSGAEYAHYIAIAAVIGWAYFLTGRTWAKIAGLIGTVFIYTALFVESSRSAILTATLAIAAISIQNTSKQSYKVMTVFAAVLIMVGMYFGMSMISTESDLIYHSVRGLTDPLAEDSTFHIHMQIMLEGFLRGITFPIGHGLGSTSIAASKFNGLTLSSEIDLSNKFMASGIIGGILYLIIIIRVMVMAFKHAKPGNLITLVILGTVISEFGQWLTGGHYSTVPLVWLMIGFLDRYAGRKEKEQSGALAPRANTG
jgi:hypothetical protein